MRKIICLCMSILLVLFIGVSCTQYQYWPIPTPSVAKYTITLVVGNGEIEEHSIKEGYSYVLPDGFVMDGKTLVGWKDADGVIHDIGEEITPVSDIVFFGDWLTGGKEAKVDGVEYDTPYGAMKSIVEEAKDGSTIEIYSDSTGGGIGIFNEGGPSDFTQGLTVDFNGHDYVFSTAPVGSPGYETQGFHFEKGNTVVLQNGTIKNDKSGAQFMIQNYSNLTLDNIAVVPDEDVTYLLSINNGVVKLKNRTNLTLAKSNGHYIFDLYYWPQNGIGYVDGCTMIVEDNSVVLSGNINISDDKTDSANFPGKVNFVVPEGYLDTQDIVITAPGYTISWVPSTYSGYTDGYEMMVLTKN